MNLLRSIENLFRRTASPRLAVKSDVEALQEEIESLKSNQKSLERIISETQEKLIAEASSPLSQLILQSHIATRDGNSLTAQDVLMNVKGMLRAFQENGMSIIGAPEETDSFDPKFHESCLPDFNPKQGQQICIRYPGIACHSAVVRKAAVGPVEVGR